MDLVCCSSYLSYFVIVVIAEMDKLSEEKQKDIRKMSNERLVMRLIRVGYSDEEIEGLDRPKLMELWAECVATGKDKTPVAAVKKEEGVKDPELEKLRLQMEMMKMQMEREKEDKEMLRIRMEREDKEKEERKRKEEELMRMQLERRLAAQGQAWEWGEVLRGLDHLQEVEVAFRGRHYWLRSQLLGDAHQALRAAGVAVPPTIREL